MFRRPARTEGRIRRNISGRASVHPRFGRWAINAFPERAESSRISAAASLSKRPALAKCVRKTPALSASVGNERKHKVEMMLEQVLKQARGDCHPNVRVSVGSPLACEAPHPIRVPLDVLGNSNDGLPAGIQFAVAGLLARKNALSFSDSSGNGHVSANPRLAAIASFREQIVNYHDGEYRVRRESDEKEHRRQRDSA